MSAASPTVTTNVTELPESRVRLDAEVAAAEVERRVQQAAKELGKTLRIPGFRKGKVPPPVVIRRLGREAVLDEALRSALGKWYAEAVDVAGISPIGEPDIDFGDLPEAGQPLVLKIEIGVRPKAKLGEYKGIEVPKREAVASEEAISAELERLRDRNSTLETVERPAEMGDQVVMDYLGKIDGVPFEGGEGRDQLLELGSGQLIPGFEDQLVGAQAGDEVLVEVSFPDDYGSEELAGQPATFEVKISEVKEKLLPELDDEFASDAAGFETIDELREDVANRLKDHESNSIEQEFERAVLDTVANNAEIEVPHELIHGRAHEMVHEMVNSLAQQGISPEMYFQITGKSEHELSDDIEPEAERSLKREAVLAAVAEAEPINPTDEEILEALEPTAERGETTPQKLFDQLVSTGRLDRMREELSHRKALELLLAEAKPVAAPASSPEADPEAEAEPEAGDNPAPGVVADLEPEAASEPEPEEAPAGAAEPTASSAAITADNDN
jgi:trigger factor